MSKGISGYDPEDKDMRGIFMARGPGNYMKQDLISGEDIVSQQLN